MESILEEDENQAAVPLSSLKNNTNNAEMADRRKQQASKKSSTIHESHIIKTKPGVSVDN